MTDEDGKGDVCGKDEKLRDDLCQQTRESGRGTGKMTVACLCGDPEPMDGERKATPTTKEQEGRSASTSPCPPPSPPAERRKREAPATVLFLFHRPKKTPSTISHSLTTSLCFPSPSSRALFLPSTQSSTAHRKTHFRATARTAPTLLNCLLPVPARALCSLCSPSHAHTL